MQISASIRALCATYCLTNTTRTSLPPAPSGRFIETLVSPSSKA